MDNIIQFPSKPMKYVNMFYDNLNSDNVEDILKSISILNSYTLAIEASNKLEDDIKAIIYFFDYFLEEFKDRTDVFLAIEENYHSKIPRIFEIADYYIEKYFVDEMLELYNNFSEEEKTEINILVNYIFNKQNKKRISFLFVDDTNDYMEIPQKVKKKEIDNYKTLLKCYISKIYNEDGVIILREFIKDKYVLNAFRIFDNFIEIVDKDVLKDCMQNNPDGTIEIIENEIYEEAELMELKFLDKYK